jgi:amino acid transporter
MTHPVPSRPELLRVLGPWTAVAVIVGAVIGSGIFKKPQEIAQNLPYFEWAAAAWALGGLLTFLGALSLAEVSAMLPRAGGNYVYLKEAFGGLWGFLWGWVDFWILRTGAMAALGTMGTEQLYAVIGRDPLAHDWELKAVTCFVILVLTAINVIGVRWGGLVQNVTTWAKVGSLVAIAVLPFVMGSAQPSLLTQHGAPPDKPFLIGFGAALLGVLWAYHGWMDLGPLAEEIREPQRNLPRALLFGVLILIAVYLSANVAYALTLSQDEMADPAASKAVAMRFAERLFAGYGENGVWLARAAITAAIMVSAYGALSANVLIGPRTSFALGRDGLFPRFMGGVHPRFRTPVAALVVQSLWTCALIGGSRLISESEKESPFDTITNYVMFAATLFEVMVVVSVIQLRITRPDWPRPYRCWGYPVTPVVCGLVLFLIVLNTLYDQPVKSCVGFGFMLMGAGVYWLIRKRG